MRESSWRREPAAAFRTNIDWDFSSSPLGACKSEEIGGILYANDGDWVESLTALVETHAGHLEIVEWTSLRDRGHARPAAAQPHLEDMPA